MNTRQIVLTLVAVDFAAFTAYVVWQHGFIGLFATVLSTLPGVHGFVDLALALTLVMAWMWVDARKHGLAVLPYFVATLALGSLGPLAYLIRREWALAPRR